MKKLLLFVSAVLLLQTCFAVKEAICVLDGTIYSPNTAGTITFVEENDKVVISGTITGLEPDSVHGIHIHQVLSLYKIFYIFS